MGMALDDVVLRSTWHPAREIKRESSEIYRSERRPMSPSCGWRKGISDSWMSPARA